MDTTPVHAARQPPQPGAGMIYAWHPSIAEAGGTG